MCTTYLEITGFDRIAVVKDIGINFQNIKQILQHAQQIAGIEEEIVVLNEKRKDEFKGNYEMIQILFSSSFSSLDSTLHSLCLITNILDSIA